MVTFKEIGNLENKVQKDEEEYQRNLIKKKQEEKSIMEPFIERLGHIKINLDFIRNRLLESLIEIEQLPDPFDLSEVYAGKLSTEITHIKLDSKAITNLANAIDNVYIQKLIPF